MFFVAGILFVAILAYILIVLRKTEGGLRKSGLSKATVEECWDGKERRKHARFPKVIDIVYSVKKKIRPGNNIKTVDISEGGAKLVLDKKFDKGTLIVMQFEIPGLDKALDVEGRIVWSEEMVSQDEDGKRLFSAGIEFVSIEGSCGALLIKHIRSIVINGR
jgi:c-di-GMP-binding flagellar brake protein YcgR